MLKFEIKRGDRLFECAHSICITYTSLGIAALSTMHNKLELPPYGHVFSLVAVNDRFIIGIPVFGVIELTINNIIPDIIIFEYHQYNNTIHDHNISVMKTSFDSIAALNFIWYYESNIDKIFLRYGRDFKNWPNEWIFGWIIRNALSHNNCVFFKDPKHPGCKWRGIDITPKNQGGMVLGKVVNCADLIMLLIDMETKI